MNILTCETDHSVVKTPTSNTEPPIFYAVTASAIYAVYPGENGTRPTAVRITQVDDEPELYPDEIIALFCTKDIAFVCGGSRYLMPCDRRWECYTSAVLQLIRVNHPDILIHFIGDLRTTPLRQWLDVNDAIFSHCL